MSLEPLVDGHGRFISDLRVSVTDRCNFRCQYCMPADGLPWLDRQEILRFEEIERVVALHPRQTLGRHAVLAAEVAPIGDRHAQIADAPAVPVEKRRALHGDSVPRE